jgi:hypothetical protein
VRWSVALLAIPLLTGCATLVNGGRDQTVPVRSEPPGAAVHVDCGKARPDAGVTPVDVVLDRSADPCSITIVKAGYEDWQVDFRRQTSRAVGVNHVVGVATGIFLSAVGLWFGDQELMEIGFDGGRALGFETATALDRKSGAAFKQVPGKVFVRLHPL